MQPVVKRRAVIYVRISQDRAGAGLGVGRQRQDCEALAASLGWTLVREPYVDNDVSAYSGKTRKRYRQMLADLDAGVADAVLCWHTDRLHRSPVELEEYVAVCERRGIVTMTCQAGELDLATPSGRMVARLLGASARYEVEHKSARTRRAQEQAAAAGKWLGGMRPFGWNIITPKEAQVDPTEGPERARLIRAVIAGESLGGLVRDLNARGVLTTAGNQWNYATLRQMLMQPRSAGLATFRGEIVGKSVFPPLVEEHEWRAVVAVLSDPERRRSMSNRPRWLMSGLILCGGLDCAQPMKSATSSTGRTNPTRIPKYRCVVPGIGHVMIRADLVDATVRAGMIRRLEKDDARDLLLSGDDGTGAALEAHAGILEGELKALALAQGRGELTVSQLTTASAGVRARLEQVRAQQEVSDRDALLREIVESDDVPATWDGYSLSRRRAIIELLAVFRVVPVGRGGRYGLDAVRVDWVDSE